MKKSQELNLDLSLIFVLTILCFFAVKEAIPNIVYVSFAGLLAIFFFPLKTFINKDLHSIISFIYFSIVIGLSVPLLFINNYGLEVTFKLLAILNTAFVIYYFYKGNKNLLVRHLVFLLFTPVILL